jgi:hypothetical protein
MEETQAAEAREAETEAVETAEAVADTDQRKRKYKQRAAPMDPIDRLFELITASERQIPGTNLVERFTLEATDPSGWTLMVELKNHDDGTPRERLHYDSQEPQPSVLISNLRADLANIVFSRVKAAEEELRNYRSAIVRTLPPAERKMPTIAPVKRTKRANGARKPKA